jgi:hypothetical protein
MGSGPAAPVLSCLYVICHAPRGSRWLRQTMRDTLAVLAGNEAIDAVSSDIFMPGETSGLALAQAIQRRRPKLPMLLTTGFYASAEASKISGIEIAGHAPRGALRLRDGTCRARRHGTTLRNEGVLGTDSSRSVERAGRLAPPFLECESPVQRRDRGSHFGQCRTAPRAALLRKRPARLASITAAAPPFHAEFSGGPDCPGQERDRASGPWPHSEVEPLNLTRWSFHADGLLPRCGQLDRKPVTKALAVPSRLTGRPAVTSLRTHEVSRRTSNEVKRAAATAVRRNREPGAAVALRRPAPLHTRFCAAMANNPSPPAFA